MITYSIPIPITEAGDYTFGNPTQAEWMAWCAGWRYRAENPGPEPHAKQLGLYAESQNLRISWERGWLACDAVRKTLVQE